MKDTVICFRISKGLRTALQRISDANRRSLSSTVEYILHEHIVGKRLYSAGEEKRRYVRKTIYGPALLRDEKGIAYPGMACDISAGGICISAPAGFPCEIGEGSRISVVFALPQAATPLTVTCFPRHVRPQDGLVRVGASFIDDGSPAYEAIRRGMMN
jgi:hypothetical protein